MPKTSGATLRSLLALGFTVLGPTSFAASHAAGSWPPIELHVDATDAARRILHSRMVLTAPPGPLTLQYPKWLPGEHGPNGPVADMAGLKISAGGRPLAWSRDPLDMNAIRIEVPRGAGSLEVSFDFLMAPPNAGGFTSGASGSDRLAMINWNQVLLFPDVPQARALTYEAGITLPPGWTSATALPGGGQDGARRLFEPVSLETLIDSPLLAGAHMRDIELGSPGGRPHVLSVAADSAAALEIPAELRSAYERLVAESGVLFGTRPYRSYRFLLALSDHVAHFGLEHHESSDNRLDERALVDEDLRKLSANLLPHEFVHTWNGKYRRPADMIVPGFKEPVRTNLLWIYEGLTQYLGFVLSGRSGVRTPELWRDRLAQVAEWSIAQRGRSWRPLEDTAVAAQILFRSGDAGKAWRRGVDFYDEGLLIWLEADVRIRQATSGRRSLDDFCRRFHGGQDGSPAVKPYTLDQVIETLRQIAPMDWRAFFNERVLSVAPQAPLAGIEEGGWRLGYSGERSALLKAAEAANGDQDLTASIGIALDKEGLISDVIPGRAAALAGVPPGVKLLAVNGRRYKASLMREALSANKRSREPLELIVENGDFVKAYSLDYHEGEKYAVLERDSSRPDRLAEIIKPQAAAPRAAASRQLP